MEKPTKPDRLPLLEEALTRGPMAGADLERTLEVSGPTLSRLIARLGTRVDRIGAARSSQYGLRREVRDLGDEWPVFIVERDARVTLLGNLRALHGAFHFVPSDGSTPLPPGVGDAVTSKLPFFLLAARPGGYMGRSIARRFSELSAAPREVRDWQDDDSLDYFIAAGTDIPGSVLVGETAKARATAGMASVRAEESTSRERARSQYADMVAGAHDWDEIGSSAEGEQPKFLAAVNDAPGSGVKHIIVKFSPPMTSDAGRRWADLLVCEHLAAAAIQRAGGVAANNEVFIGHGRCFLESERFDRTPGRGRVGVVGLGVTTYALTGRTAEDWGGSAALLEARGHLSPSETHAIRWAQCFGSLIANEDMHTANAALLWERGQPFRFAPVYDMLPMRYRPNAQGEVLSRSFEPTGPEGDAHGVWPTAAAASVDFWQTAANDPRVSPEMRQEAARNAKKVQHLIGVRGAARPSRGLADDSPLSPGVLPPVIFDVKAPPLPPTNGKPAGGGDYPEE